MRRAVGTKLLVAFLCSVVLLTTSSYAYVGWAQPYDAEAELPPCMISTEEEILNLQSIVQTLIMISVSERALAALEELSEGVDAALRAAEAGLSEQACQLALDVQEGIADMIEADLLCDIDLLIALDRMEGEVQAQQLRTDRVIRVPEDQNTIREAILAATPGDTILVGPGIYEEPRLLIDKDALTLRSTHGPGETVIRGEIYVTAFSVTIGGSGFTITGSPGHGIIAHNASYLTVSGNVITSNGQTGITLRGIYRGTLIADNTVTNNHTHGVHLDGPAGLQTAIVRNDISNNGHGTGRGSGVFIGASTNVSMRGNVIGGNAFAAVHPGVQPPVVEPPPCPRPTRWQRICRTGCRIACAIAGAAPCVAVSIKCTVGGVITLPIHWGTLYIPCTAAIIAACGVVAPIVNGAGICDEICNWTCGICATSR